MTLSNDRAGWRLRDWLAAVGISRSTYYMLESNRAPYAVTVGRAHIVTESPADWLARVGTPRRSNIT